MNIMNIISGFVSAVFISITTFISPIKTSLLKISPTQIPASTTSIIPFQQNKLWDLVNQQRVNNKQLKYEENEPLCVLAKQRLDETKTVWASGDLDKLTKKSGFIDMSEAIAKDFNAEQLVIDGWNLNYKTKSTLIGNYKYGCLRCENTRCVLLSANISKVNTASVINKDPPVLCTIHANCGGGTTPLRQSECNNSVCCGFSDGKWVFYKDRNLCIKDQGNNQGNNNSSNNTSTTTHCAYDGGPDFGEITYSECGRLTAEYVARKIIAPLPTLDPNAFNTDAAVKAMQDIVNEPIPVSSPYKIDGTIHWATPTPIKVPVGFTNFPE